MTVIALAVLAGCATTPPSNAMLDQARADYLAAQGNPQARNLASPELQLAADALASANAAWTRGDAPAEVDHLAYLARQRVAIAQEAVNRRAAEQSVAGAQTGRDQVRLAARTSEADMARMNAEAAQLQAQASQRQSDMARQQAEASQREAAASQRESAASQQQAEASKQAAVSAQARSGQLEAQIRELNATKTSRGLVITIGDVLFDTGKSELKAGGLRSVDRLSGFLKQYPQRRAMVEGFTDSTGSESINADLSERRANAVRSAMVDRGVGGERIETRGYGEAFPAASNDSADGRRSNRRVEIILSDDSGVIVPR